MGFIHGNDGQVVSTIFPTDLPTRAISWTAPWGVVAVETTVFNANNHRRDFEPGISTHRPGVVVIRAHTDDTPEWPGTTTALLTLRTASSAPYWQFRGSAFITEIPLSRTRGENTEDIAYAFQPTGIWSFSNVAS